jgi:predicted transcriptional regulator of viral defense system
MSSNGISGVGRAELAAVTGRRRFVTPEDVAGELGVGSRDATRKLARWAEQGWLRRVRRGLYIPVPVDAEHPSGWSEDALVVASVVWSPCFFSGWTSASMHALTEQVFRTVIVKTTARVRHAEARLLDADYLLAHVEEDSMQWGLATVWREETRLQIADPARTVVDILDAPRIGGGIRSAATILAAYLDEHDPMTLIAYAERLGNGAVFKRLGYLLDALERDEAALREACHDRLSAGIARLDPDAPATGPQISRWHIRVNVRVVAENPS